MQCYQIFLTEKCNRQCSFCYINKNDYVETAQNIEKFILEVKKQNERSSSFSIDLFGGEPLLNMNGIKQIVEGFSTYRNIQINLITNGDFIEKLYDYEYLQRIKVRVTAYDFFYDTQKYSSIVEEFKSRDIIENLSFSYTFTSKDFQHINTFIDFCRNHKVKSSVRFSHDKKSWKDVTTNVIYSTLYSFYDQQFKTFYNKTTFDIQESISNQLRRFIQCLFDDNVQECNCMTETNKVFYRGKFINTCIRFLETNLKKHYFLNRCQSCQYKTICSKSCVAEYEANDVDEKLCIIQKVLFDVLSKNFLDYENDHRLNQIISYFSMF